MKNSFVIQGPSIYGEDKIHRNESLWIENGVIHKIGKISHANTLKFPETSIVIPGMIDLHIHGCAGADVMDAQLNALSTMCKALPEEGTTSFLATTMSESPERIEKALTNVKDYMHGQNKDGAEVLGVHLEGPFLSPFRPGAQQEKHILPPDLALLKRWLALSPVKMVTIAPEEKGALQVIRYLKEQKVIVSIGHTNATVEQAESAFNEGASHATHLFNAMTPIHHREPGAAMAALLDKRIMCELIVDGIHLHPAMNLLAFRMKGSKRLVLVTDAMRAKCLGDGEFDLGGQQVRVRGNEARLTTQQLAGSVLKMRDAFENMISCTDCSIQDLIQMTSVNPAKELHLYERIGSIIEGKDADLVILDKNFQIIMTICKGQIAYQSDS